MAELDDEGMTVLILVVVEDVLVPRKHVLVLSTTQCLNPCCGGRCSSTRVSYS